MRPSVRSLVSAVVVLSGVVVCAQVTVAQPQSFRALTTAVPQASGSGVTELRVRWATTRANGTAAASSVPVHAFTIVESRTGAGSLRRERRPELSSDRLVTIVQDDQGRALDWRIVMNPRLVRAEVPGPDDRLTGQVIEQPDGADLFLALPELPAARTVWIYQPHWTGSEWLLDPLGSLPLGRR